MDIIDIALAKKLAGGGGSGGSYPPSGGIPMSDLSTTVTSALLPAGGTTGQFLVKASDTDYDASWTTVPDAEGVVF